MRKTEVYQIRLDSQEKKQAFAVFKQLGITPAQAIRLFLKQVVFTKSIPFNIENQQAVKEPTVEFDPVVIPPTKNTIHASIKPKQDKDKKETHPSQTEKVTPNPNVSPKKPHTDDLFDQLDALLNFDDKFNP